MRTTRQQSWARHRVLRPAAPRTVIIAGGLIASLLMHGLLLTPFLWGGHRNRAPITPNMQGASARPQDQKAPESMQVVFVDEESRTIRDSSEDRETTHFLPPPAVLPMPVLHIQAAELGSIEKPDDRQAVEADGDQAGRALLFGRYMGQVSARIERAWLRPRSVPRAIPDGAESAHPGAFSCRVQISQDRHGAVEEVTLQQCTDDPRWQISLVRVVMSASPLPAPPDPSVFSNLLTLEFDADPYVAGASDDGFEPPGLAALAAAVPSASDVRDTAVSHTAEPSSSSPGLVTRRLRVDGSVDLTIVGSSAASTMP